jgi:endonuclease V-like protein UPF0215 family
MIATKIAIAIAILVILGAVLLSWFNFISIGRVFALSTASVVVVVLAVIYDLVVKALA